MKPKDLLDDLETGDRTLEVLSKKKEETSLSVDWADGFDTTTAVAMRQQMHQQFREYSMIQYAQMQGGFR